MAEQLAFEEIARDRRAIDGDERPVLALRQAVDRGGTELFPGAAFPGDEYRRRRRRRALYDPIDRLHRERAPDQPAELIAPELFLEGFHRVGELAPLERVAHGHAQALARQRLDDEVEGPLAHRFDRGIDRALRGDDDHFGRQSALFDLAQDVDAVHVGEIDIQRHDIGRTVVELREGFAAGLHGCRTDAFGGQIGGVCRGERGNVLDDQNLGNQWRHNGRTPHQPHILALIRKPMLQLLSISPPLPRCTLNSGELPAAVSFAKACVH